MAVTVGQDLELLLQGTFAAKHVKAALKHFQDMTAAFQLGAWEQTIVKGGKFVEAALKALYVYVGNTLPPAREFKAGKVMDIIGNLPAGSFDDAIRVTIPRACRFVYDIASNRGARHDPDEIDPNQMDARVLVATVSWVLAEMVRYAQKGSVDAAAVEDLVASLTQRQYPFIEEVDGRVYFDVRKASARVVGVLSLWRRHPARMTTEELKAAIRRHGFSDENAAVAVTRVRSVVDVDEQGRMRLRVPGIREADTLIASQSASGTTKRRKK